MIEGGDRQGTPDAGTGRRSAGTPEDTAFALRLRCRDCELLARRDCASRARAQGLAAAERHHDDKTRQRLLSCVALPLASARGMRADCEVQYRRSWPLSKPLLARRHWLPLNPETRCAPLFLFAAHDA